MSRSIFVKQGFTIIRNIGFSIVYYYKKWGQVTKNIAVGLALVLLYTILSSCSPWFVNQFDMARSAAATTIVPPLSTRGSTIIDAKGRIALLRGVNWFGMELKEHTPHGLWVRDYKDMLAQMKSLGYNVIRLPYSVQALRSGNISGVDFYIGSNKDFQGKTPLQVMDLVIQEAQRQGLFILLDSQTLKDGQIPELWYGDGFTEKDWIDSWTLLAKRYKGYSNVIGADLKNEPHGRASWGTGDRATDWRLAAERAGNSILSVNPNWLIVVEGVVENVPGQKQSRYWWGANLEGVRKYPVRLRVPKKLVYSPHEYGNLVDIPWFRERTFPKNLYQRWEIGFQYIATQGIAPIWIGEFGGYQVDTKSKEGIWQRQLVDYIDKKNLSFTYWCWNPNSKDTGGILLDDWKNINTDKQKLLARLLR
ncbi:glycoside hydrolase family 5 protein [Brasilonema sp. CT11]|nr:glycoside hydrolase family 5 protein [Brasilonema sp. CT11]